MVAVELFGGPADGVQMQLPLQAVPEPITVTVGDGHTAPYEASLYVPADRVDGIVRYQYAGSSWRRPD